MQDAARRIIASWGSGESTYDAAAATAAAAAAAASAASTATAAASSISRGFSAAATNGAIGPNSISLADMQDQITLAVLLVITIVTMIAAWKLSDAIFTLYTFTKEMCFVTIRVVVAASIFVVVLFWLANDEIKLEAQQLAAAMNRALLEQRAYEKLHRAFSNFTMIP